MISIKDGVMQMKNEENFQQLGERAGLDMDDMVRIVKAVSQVYPMIIIANLTRNTYSMLRDDDFLYNEVVKTGSYDELIDNNVENIHSNYRALFQECFSREHLINSFKLGKTEVYAELYQKNREGQYQWVSTQVIRLENENGDVCHICLNRVLDGIVEERHGQRK
jgi:hypothetical protein